MKLRKTIRKAVRAASLASGTLSLLIMLGCTASFYMLPDSYSAVAGKPFQLESVLPVQARAQKTGSVTASATLRAGESYSAQLSLFGVVPVKTVRVNVVNETDVIPGGEPFGIKLTTEGVMVVGMSDVETVQGPQNPAYRAGIRVGDILLALNGQTVSGNDDVERIILNSNGKPVSVSLKRNGVAYSLTLHPARSSDDHSWKAGIWVRDSTAGIGTLTFFCPSTGVFAGLGHGICDVDTGELMPLSQGDIVRAYINGILKGAKGQPGELKGYFLSSLRWGALSVNGETGVYGVMDGFPQGKAVPVAMKQQVHTGAAVIYTTLNGIQPHAYQVVIERVHFNDNGESKNMVIHVTDPALLAKTGGIVQGMSGSPILQNGRLVGAVTHVFVNDPTRGYGIFAENMLDTTKTLAIGLQKDVS